MSLDSTNINWHLSELSKEQLQKSMDQTDKLIDLLRKSLEHIDKLNELVKLQGEVIAKYKEVIEIKKI